MRKAFRVVLPIVAAVCALAAPALASFSGTDVFIPSLGSGPGASSSQWNACIWVHNPNTSPVNVTFRLLLRDQPNPSPQAYNATIPAGDTRRYDNAFATLFGVTGKTFGAVRVTTPAGQPIIVNARSYSTPAGGDQMDTVGQFYSAIPASFAIGPGQTTELLGAYQTTPQASSEFRYNYGFVETTGNAVTVQVTALDETGMSVGSKSYTLGGYQASQYNITDLLPSVSTTDLRLEVAVTSGPGQVVAFGSAIANRSNDPSTFEMSFRDQLLAANSPGGGLTSVSHDGTLTGDGTSATPLGIATGGVAKAKLAASGGTSGQVLGTDGTNLAWQNPGLTLPFAGTANSTNPALMVTNTSGFIAIVGSVPSVPGTTLPAVLGVAGGGSNNAQGYNSGSLTGVWGDAKSGVGVAGTSDTLIGVAGLGALAGVAGTTTVANGNGVIGSGPNGTGVLGESDTGIGVHGESNSGYAGKFDGKVAISASSPVGSDIFTVNNTGGGRGLTIVATSDTALWANSTSGAGVDARSSSGTALAATSTTGYAGVFNGKVQVNGNFNVSGGTKNFVIDHPLDPENRVLVHAAVESSEVLNIYSGNVTTDAEGRAVVRLPDWFEAENADFRYQLTVIGRFAQAIVEKEIDNNRLAIRTNLAMVKVSWQVTARRNDAWMKAHPFVAEQDKPAAERGFYLAPEAFGQPEEKSVGWARDPEMIRRMKEERAALEQQKPPM